MLNSDMSEEEVSRLAAANKARMGLDDVGEEDPELEKALLAMFVEQVGNSLPSAIASDMRCPGLTLAYDGTRGTYLRMR